MKYDGLRRSELRHQLSKLKETPGTEALRAKLADLAHKMVALVEKVRAADCEHGVNTGASCMYDGVYALERACIGYLDLCTRRNVQWYECLWL